MRITHEADYAIRIVSVLMSGENKPIPASKLAETAGVTQRFSLKILRKLVGAGIAKSQKGMNGGYFLAMEPKDISLGLIIESIDGPFELNQCLNDEFTCTHVQDKTFCKFHHIFNEVNAKLKKELYSITMDTFKDN